MAYPIQGMEFISLSYLSLNVDLESLTEEQSFTTVPFRWHSKKNNRIIKLMNDGLLLSLIQENHG